MDPPPLAMIRACIHYSDVSRKLILAFKHGDGLQLTPFLTSLMARDFAIITDGEDSLVVPVPLHRQRYFRRRCNQSAELARRLCRITARGSLATYTCQAPDHGRPGRAEPPPAAPQYCRGIFRQA